MKNEARALSSISTSNSPDSSVAPSPTSNKSKSFRADPPSGCREPKALRITAPHHIPSPLTTPGSNISGLTNRVENHFTIVSGSNRLNDTSIAMSSEKECHDHHTSTTIASSSTTTTTKDGGYGLSQHLYNQKSKNILTRQFEKMSLLNAYPREYSHQEIQKHESNPRQLPISFNHPNEASKILSNRDDTIAHFLQSPPQSEKSYAR